MCLQSGLRQPVVARIIVFSLERKCYQSDLIKEQISLVIIAKIANFVLN